MQKHHAKSAKLSQLIEKKIDQGNMYSIKEAETLQEFYDYALRLAMRVEFLEKQTVFLDSLLNESHNQYYEMANIAEQKVLRKCYLTATDPETKDAVREIGIANALLLKK